MNAAPASVTRAAEPPSAPPPTPPAPNMIRNTRAFLRKLSLKAEKNWHQNRGAKRRLAISDPDIGAFLAGCCVVRGGRVPAAAEECLAGKP